MIGLVVYGGIWTLLGAGIAALARPRVAELCPAGGTGPPQSPPWLLWCLVAVLIAGSLLGVALRAGLIDRLGLNLQSALSSALVNAGLAAGFLLGARVLWETPPHLGYLTDESGGRGDAWGMGAWLAWTSQYWLPLTLLILVALRVLASLRYERAERLRVARARAVVTTGRRTKGVVIEARETGMVTRDRPRAHFVVRFIDETGSPRSVTKTALFPRTELPRPGDRAVVWYDPAASGADTVIAVVLADPGRLGERDMAEALDVGGLVIH
ncbi:hypothetical protein I3J09_20595 [Streptomyces clavuligerus]|uniref:DUF3592 domain-containing protein n=1 Tax=Streptomyces clavuligerus TaxID=1901 RepID=UPI00020D91D2|nr:DUF3592 domain-containing protein [Streptomyces clavuligerus]AXU15015.1 hypothetical protein D1794_21165 [Streptomyces clavuligerus]MBY6305066.1 hypothetical protein [Streptomyces clavuligerus]QCS07789.1 hypothetical protein CRV15_20530 [Streptomyces clavuligerus]QPJ92868.1 hypothetical protein GE265_07555 [Streptomyces clavuligerus]QPL65021.1 hypothetical protein I3J04_20580 [Streptomyces clavuligerus]